MKSPNHHNTRVAEARTRSILNLLHARQMTVQQIADEFGVSRTSIYHHLAPLLASPKRVYVASHIKAVKGRSAPVYAAGRHEDAIAPGYRKPKQEDRLEMQRAKLIAAMATPGTAQQICERMFLTVSRTRHYIRELHVAKAAYIKGWAHPGKRGDWAPIYALGKRWDAKKPAPESRAKRYQKEKADPVRYDRILAKKRASHHIAKLRKMPNTWLNMLGGGA